MARKTKESYRTVAATTEATAHQLEPDAAAHYSRSNELTVAGYRIMNIEELSKQILTMSGHSASCSAQCRLIEEHKMCGLA